MHLSAAIAKRWRGVTVHRPYIVRVEASLIEHCPLMSARYGDRLNKRLESYSRDNAR